MAEAFDTHKAYQDLTEGNRFAHEQAEALVELVNGAIAGNVATKSDIERVSSHVDSVRSELKSDIERVSSHVDSVRNELKSDLKTLQSDLKVWMFKALGTVVAVIVVTTKLLDFILDKL